MPPRKKSSSAQTTSASTQSGGATFEMRASTRVDASRKVSAFEESSDEEEASGTTRRAKPPTADSDSDERRANESESDRGGRAKRRRTTRRSASRSISPGAGKRGGRGRSSSRGRATDDEEDPLDAFMAENDVAMDADVAETEQRVKAEREKREEREKKEREEKAEAEKGVEAMEVSEEDALLASFAAAAKAAAARVAATITNGASTSGQTSTPIALGANKSLIASIARPVVPSQRAAYVPVKKARRATKRARALDDVFEQSDDEGENDSTVKKDAADGDVAKASENADEVAAEEDIDDDDDEAWAQRQQAKLSKTEKLGKVNHDEIDYEPVKKDFYIESKEISSMTKAQTRALRAELDGIKCRGKKVPKPIKTWAHAGLSGRIHELIRRCGFEKPMPIQAQALPVIMSGRDCIGIAKTGSGKTLAYILPMLRHINAQEPLKNGDGPIGMIMGPTRELVTQIGKEAKRYGKALGFNAVSVYGGSGIAAQIGELKRGAEIVACTPGRMIDILTTGGGKITNLRRVTYIVLDEADRMFDMGFEPQITRILANLRPDRQTVMFSATFPHTMEALARAALENPVEIQIGGKSVVNSDIDQVVEIRPEEDRFLRVLELLGEWCERGKIIIFVASQDKADSTFKELLKSGYPCLSLHGSKEQSDRHSTISDFKSDVCNILVATSVAARGLDVKDLRLVINYDTPNHLEDYVHRVGRTGRAGQKGTAVTFISEDEEKFAPDLVKALKDSKQTVPRDVQRLADEFTRKRKEGLVGAAGSGFGGSGFKFDQGEHDALKKQKRDAARAAGLEIDDSESDSEEEPVFGGDAGEDEGPIYASVGPSGQAAAQAQAAAAQATATVQAAGAVPANGAPQQQQPSNALATAGAHAGMTPAQIAQAAAQSVFAKMKAPKTGGIRQTNPGGAQSQAVAGSRGGVDKAIALAQSYALAHGVSEGTARAAALAAALNAQHAKPTASSAATGSHFETELEINDFPQFARYKVTQKETIAQIMEMTGAAVTAKGQYAQPGRPLAPGDRKLYLLIEGPSERVVKEGKNYVKQIIEQAIAKQALPGGGQPQGRYRV